MSTANGTQRRRTVAKAIESTQRPPKGSDLSRDLLLADLLDTAHAVSLLLCSAQKHVRPEDWETVSAGLCVSLQSVADRVRVECFGKRNARGNAKQEGGKK